MPRDGSSLLLTGLEPGAEEALDGGGESIDDGGSSGAPSAAASAPGSSLAGASLGSSLAGAPSVLQASSTSPSPGRDDAGPMGFGALPALSTAWSSASGSLESGLSRVVAESARTASQ